MKLFEDFINLFYPDTCLNCNKQLYKTEKFLCSTCSYNIPLINIEDYSDNEIVDVFFGITPICKATSFLYFKKDGMTQKLIHELKYKNNEHVGLFLGEWFGHILAKSNAFDNIDFIVPVPLHASKLKKRGYNQLTLFGKSLSRALNTKFENKVLRKTMITSTQTFKKRFDRFSENQAIFKLNDMSIFENKHILLIDDVITTGATLKACCKELRKVENIRISIATIAFASKK